MKYLLLVLLVISFSACKKLDVNKQYAISSWTQNMDSYSKLRTELRLAFGKTVANAFKNEHFRDYIKKLSENSIDSNYNEILFSLHKNDIIYGSTTFADLIKISTDAEVFSLFGDSLIQKTLNFDPCVCLKIPDILYSLNWNVSDFAPCVYVETPNNLDGQQNFLVYHYSGYQSLINNFEITKPEHYYVMVKYSEDYTLMNTSTWNNEKGISLFEFLPQLKKKWDEFQPKILDIAISSIYGPDNVFISKTEAYKLWYYLNGFSGSLFSQTASCGETCLRDCGKQVAYIPTILSNVQVSNYLFYFNVGAIFQESTSMLFGFWVSKLLPENFEDYYGIPSIRFKNLGLKAKSIGLNIKKECFENIKSADIPYLDLEYDEQSFGNKVNVNIEIIPKMNTKTIDFCTHSLRYADGVNQFYYEFGSPLVINSTYLPLHGVSAYYYCEAKESTHTPALVDINFKY